MDESKTPDDGVKRTVVTHELRAGDFHVEQIDVRDVKRGEPKQRAQAKPKKREHRITR